MVEMGFPQKRPLDKGSFFSGRGGEYVCPRCASRVEVSVKKPSFLGNRKITSNNFSQELPSQCSVCSLTLVSSPHLARSYHHLFPVAPFEELDDATELKATNCFACNLKFNGNGEGGNDDAPSVCPRCKNTYCFQCDVFIHEQLHNCPGCEIDKAKGIYNKHSA